MYFIGLDVHQKYITVCALTEKGEIHSRCTVRCIQDVVDLIGELGQPCEVCYEASTGYGFIYETLLPVTRRTVVAHPGLLRLIYRSSKKNDRADAEKLAKLLYIGEVPAVYVPSPQVRAWRELITFRRRIVEKRTRARNGIRGLLAEAAWQATRRSPGVRAFRDRIAREDPQRRKIATVATAHYLIRVMWSMLKHNTTWTEPKLVA